MCSMRACTAVVTEMSWNSSDDQDALYRADIEFIQPEDWERELKVLFEELLDMNGRVRSSVSLVLWQANTRVGVTRIEQPRVGGGCCLRKDQSG